MAPQSECNSSLLRSQDGLQDVTADSLVPCKGNEQGLEKMTKTIEEVREEQLQAQQQQAELNKKKTVLVNERSRKMIFKIFQHLNTNLNVLVLGPSESGKSSLINSMSMALTQKWADKAKYCPGRKHIIDECVLHRNGKGGKVVFSDTRGFEDVHNDDKAVLILRYVLEGRIPAKCIPCVLLMEKELIKKRYHKIYGTNRRIDCVLFVSALDDQPASRLKGLLQKAVSTSKHVSINRLPLISVITKKDTLTEPEAEQRLQDMSKTLATDSCTRLVNNYRCELDSWSDESANPSSMESSYEQDSLLLAVWRDIIHHTAACGGSHKRKRAYSSPDSARTMCSCLPFRFDYNRLRSGSF